MPYVHKQYFICPFPVYDDVVRTQINKYTLKKNCTIVKSFHNALKNVEDDATLLIAGHGVEGGDEISNGLTDHRRLWLIPEGLAQLISKVWLLPTTHRKIRLLGCECSAFARKLALALEAYDNVAVGGYVDSMNYDGHDPKTGRGSNLTQIDFGPPIGIRLFTKAQILSQNLERVEWYNNKGQKIAKPDLPKTVQIDD